MKIKSLLLFNMLFSIILSLNATVFAASSTGTHAFEFVQIMNTAHADAVSNAVTAYHTFDAYNTNPASLASMSSPMIYTEMTQYLEDIDIKGIAWVNPTKWGVIGLSGYWIDYGSYSRTTISDPDGQSSGSISNSGSLAQMYYAASVNTVHVGMSVKVVNESLDSYNANQSALDVGIQTNINKSLSIGAAIQNIALSEATFIQETSSLSKDIRMGIMYIPNSISDQLTLSLDVIYKDESEFVYCGGMMARIHPKLVLKSGYSSQSDLFGMSMGMGLDLGKFDVDFSYQPHEEFNDTYRVGLKIQF